MLPYLTVASLHWYLAANWCRWPRWRGVANYAVEVRSARTTQRCHLGQKMPSAARLAAAAADEASVMTVRQCLTGVGDGSSAAV
jgi:hypothetical protein